MSPLLCQLSYSATTAGLHRRTLGDTRPNVNRSAAGSTPAFACGPRRTNPRGGLTRGEALPCRKCVEPGSTTRSKLRLINPLLQSWTKSRCIGERSTPPHSPPLVFRVFALEFLFDPRVMFAPEPRQILCDLNRTMIGGQNVHYERNAAARHFWRVVDAV